ncbi:hypothetical protein TNCV_259271 [Trichonephila clavipes]|uniref:Uncharacterized protein n=1 Tax=Trichonephila clavipes TaxID=2585209 RepID=A0A8X6RSR9_TRICX|nr:hypothetical protein TNCV_259271 [Trichonephila clavipes]
MTYEGKKVPGYKKKREKSLSMCKKKEWKKVKQKLRFGISFFSSVVSDPWLLGSEDSSIAQCKLFASERKCISNGMQENLSKGGDLTSIKLNFNNALKKGNIVSTYATIS